MKIRTATERDLSSIVALNAFAQQQHADSLTELFRSPVNSALTFRAFEEFLSIPNGLLLLADDGETAGYLWAQFQERPADWARLELKYLSIHHLVVAPQFRRRGIGTLLLTKAIDMARDKGIKRVELDVWSFNSEAKHFYAKQGFEVYNERMSFQMGAT
jgi:ribosomal protein S18 acetylase RimI-like enzyme